LIDDYYSEYRLRKATRNSDGESVLQATRLQLGSLGGDSMRVLLDEAANYLEFGISSGLDDSDLDAAIHTMETMWSLGEIGNK
jgi:hypothetical protein